jgi:signal peptide peptidase SppA
VTVYLDEMRAEAWAMDPGHLEVLMRKAEVFFDPARAQVLADLEARDLEARSSGATSSRREDQPYMLRGDTAIVSVSGVLMKSVPWWHKYAGVQSTSTPDVANAIAAAAADPQVRSIVLQIDSPGGQAFGVHAAAEAIGAAAKRKPVNAVVESLAASGAYWLASQAQTIAASPDSLVGSIGVYQVVVDSSAAAMKDGVQVHVIRSGEHKGAAVPGSKVTPEQLSAIQSLVDGLAALFRTSVSSGRKLEPNKTASVATGQVWLAGEAQKLGLVDSVEPVAKALSRLAPMEDMMSFTKETQDEAAKAAAQAERKRLGDLKAAFPKHLEFALAQFDAGSTVEQAKLAFVPVLERELEQEKKASADARELAAKAQAQAAATPPPPPPPAGAAPLATKIGGETAGAKDFMALVNEHAEKAKCSKKVAMEKVSTENPQAHFAWLRSQPAPSRTSSAEYRRV